MHERHHAPLDAQIAIACGRPAPSFPLSMTSKNVGTVNHPGDQEGGAKTPVAEMETARRYIRGGPSRQRRV
jgi:hypothetical protein